MDNQPEIIRDYSYPLFTHQIDPEAYYLPSQFKLLRDTLPFYRNWKVIYEWLKAGKIDCIEITSTRRRLIQGKDFISFLFGQ